MSSPLARPLVAELLGTFLLTLAVSVSLVVPVGLPTPLVAGLTLLVLVYAIGSISGAHVNPAVTVGLLSAGKIEPTAAIGYIIAQCIGALLVAPFIALVALAAPAIIVSDSLPVVLSEFAGAFVLVFAIASVAFGRTSKEASGLTIGAGLTVGAMIASGGSNAAINPAVALGLGFINISYMVAPLAGGIAAALLYAWFVGAKK